MPFLSHIRFSLKQNSSETPNLEVETLSNPRPYFWHEIRLSTHREKFGESQRPSEAI